MAAITDARTTRKGSTPRVIGLLADPVRWKLLGELAVSDRAVRELTALTGKPQNLVSYHLRELKGAGLVRARQSAADGRDRYYSIDLDECRRQVLTAGIGIHPALTAPAEQIPSGPVVVAGPSQRVLFLCTGNSARSQMAEALLIHLSAGTVEAASAGSHPKPLHRLAVRVMQRRGLDIATQRSKHLDDVLGEPFDHVITLCDLVREVCPEFAASPSEVHWSMANPAAGGTGRALERAFERAAVELESRITHFLVALSSTINQESRHVR